MLGIFLNLLKYYSAIIEYSKNVIYLEESDIAHIDKSGCI